MGRNRQVEQQAGKGAKAGTAHGPDGLKAKRHSTPEERRAAVTSRLPPPAPRPPPPEACSVDETTPRTDQPASAAALQGAGCE